MGSLPRRFSRLSARWERLLYRATACCVILLLISQLLMLNDGVRRRLSGVELLEGVPYGGEKKAE
ncbi:MAG: hypothetical protein GX883_06695 [Firmicutes bacterium]|nr:hypothetical protein [Bacillota bacterium]